MEVKVNKEIRDYKEKGFFGLTYRQIILIGTGLALSVFVYYKTGRYVPLDVASWILMAVMLPFGAMAFISYNGMNAWQLLVCWFRFTLLMPKRLIFAEKNLYNEILRDVEQEIRKETRAEEKRKRKEKKTDETESESEQETG